MLALLLSALFLWSNGVRVHAFEDSQDSFITTSDPISFSASAGSSRFARNLRLENNIIVKQKKDLNRNEYIVGKELSPSDLGTSYNEKTEQFTGAKVIVGDQIVVKEKASKAFVNAQYMSSQEYINDMLYVSGSASVDFIIMSGSGSIVYEELYTSKKDSIILYQIGYREYETEEISQDVLQKENNYKTARFFHDEAKGSQGKLKKFLDEYGRYYVRKLTKGVYAVRKIIFKLDSEETRKRIEAKVTIKIGIGFLAIQFGFEYKKLSTKKQKNMSITIEKVSIGGNPNHLNVDFETYDDIKRKLASSWNNFMTDPTSLGVLSAELSAVSSAIHFQYDTNLYDQIQINRKIQECRLRINELNRQEVEIKLTKTRMLNFLNSLKGGGVNEHMKPFNHMTDDFIEYHLKKVKEKLEIYLGKNSSGILFTEIPPKGTLQNSMSLQKIDLSVERTGRWLERVELDEEQMNTVFNQLKGGVLFATNLKDKNKDEYPILWDGPLAYSKAVGVPNQIFFFHKDMDIVGMTLAEKFSLRKFSILGKDWNPLKEEPNTDALLIPNPNVDIDFNKLPAWIDNIQYEMAKEYESPPRKYEGLWRKGEFSEGTLINKSYMVHSFISCEMNWEKGTNGIYDNAKVTFHDGSVYTGQVKYNRDDMSVVMHGNGSCQRDRKIIDCISL